MPILNQTLVKCDAPNCDKSIAFDANNGIPQDVIEANPWLKTNRVVSTSDNRVFSYCSDVCLLKGVESGVFNPPEPKAVIESVGGAAAIAQAAMQARQKQQAEESLKKGEPVRLALS